MIYNPQVNNIKLSGYTVSQPSSEELIFYKSWKESLLPFIMVFGFFILWYYGLMSATGHSDPNLITRIYKIISEEPPLLIFFLVPLVILLPLLYRLGSKVLNKEKYYINGKRGIIMQNNRLVTAFADIKAIKSQKSELIVELHDGDKIRLIKSSSSLQLKNIAGIISMLTKIDIN